MSHVLTLVASNGNPDIAPHHIKTVGEIIGGMDQAEHWLEQRRAVDLIVLAPPGRQVLDDLREAFSADKIDVFVTPKQGRRKKLLLADMDSTMVTCETLDDLAEHAGIKDQIAAITARAMEGEIDFEDALRERVGLIKGLPLSALQDTMGKIALSAGARVFVQTMAQHGAHCVLVSGGFTFFTQDIAAQLGFHAHHGNTLEMADGVLSGTVADPILDKHAKVEFLEHYLREKALDSSEALTIGDGANDIPMLQKAGLGIGYHPKHAVAAEIPNLIIHGDLTAALYVQGYHHTDFK